MAETFFLLLIRADTAQFIWHEECKTNSTQQLSCKLKVDSICLIIKATILVLEKVSHFLTKGKLKCLSVSIKVRFIGLNK